MIIHPKETAPRSYLGAVSKSLYSNIIYVVLFSGNRLFNGFCGVAKGAVADAFVVAFDTQLLQEVLTEV